VGLELLEKEGGVNLETRFRFKTPLNVLIFPELFVSDFRNVFFGGLFPRVEGVRGKRLPSDMTLSFKRPHVLVKHALDHVMRRRNINAYILFFEVCECVS
jgi:hypothetical protein